MERRANVDEVLEGGFHNSSAQMAARLEKAFAEKSGVRYATAHANGTARTHRKKQAAFGDRLLHEVPACARFPGSRECFPMTTITTKTRRGRTGLLCAMALACLLTGFAADVRAGSRLFESSTTLPVSLYGVAVGTEKVLEFDLPEGAQGAAEATLELLVDDIDEPAEALLFLNDHGPIAWPASILGEGEHLGAVPIPLDKLRAGKNVFRFVFADDLGGSTMGYVILKAGLRLDSEGRAEREEKAAAASEAYRNEILKTEGLVSYWPLDAAKGGTAPDVADNRDASLRNCIAARVGVASECVNFNGQDSVMLVDAESLASALNGAPAITVELWIAPDRNRTVAQDVMTLRGRENYGSVTTLEGLALKAFMRAAKEAIPAAFGQLTARRFSHVVLIGDFEKGTLGLYVDGAGGFSARDFAGKQARYGGNTTPTSFGAANAECSNAFAGLIDEVAIYRRALDQETIQRHYELGLRSAEAARTSGTKLTAGDLPGTGLSYIACRARNDARSPWPVIDGFYPGNIIELADGTWLTEQGQKSKDRGRTWSSSEPLFIHGGQKYYGFGILRLPSGDLGMYYDRGWSLATAIGNGNSNWFFHRSSDEGKTWSEPVKITLDGATAGLSGTMFALKDGRLVVTTYSQFLPRQGLWGGSWGTYKGHRIKTESEGHFGEMEVGRVYTSDDFGRSWKACDGWIMGWREGPEKWTDSFTEPSCVELGDGRLFMMGRSLVGRIFACESTDRGDTWGYAYPTELMSSFSPGRLVRLPGTGDLLYIWNQISREENRRGLRRSRLSSAISKDGGKTWTHFKNIAAIKSLADKTRIPPDPLMTPCWANDDVGEVPEDFEMWHYPAATVMGDELFLSVAHNKIRLTTAKDGKEEATEVGGALTWIIPVSWFCE